MLYIKKNCCFFVLFVFFSMCDKNDISFLEKNILQYILKFTNKPPENIQLFSWNQVKLKLKCLVFFSKRQRHNFSWQNKVRIELRIAVCQVCSAFFILAFQFNYFIFLNRFSKEHWKNNNSHPNIMDQIQITCTYVHVWAYRRSKWNNSNTQ